MDTDPLREAASSADDAIEDADRRDADLHRRQKARRLLAETDRHGGAGIAVGREPRQRFGVVPGPRPEGMFNDAGLLSMP
mgnify:CR=1 FL=1